MRKWIGGLQEHVGTVALLVLLTHWKPFDPLLAIAVAAKILWPGGHLVWHSAVGLLDYSDPKAGREIRTKLDAICTELATMAYASEPPDTARSSRCTCCSPA